MPLGKKELTKEVQRNAVVMTAQIKPKPQHLFVSCTAAVLTVWGVRLRSPGASMFHIEALREERASPNVC